MAPLVYANLVFQRGSDVADRDRTSVPIADSSHASLHRPTGEETRSQYCYVLFLRELFDVLTNLASGALSLGSIVGRQPDVWGKQLASLLLWSSLRSVRADSRSHS